MKRLPFVSKETLVLQVSMYLIMKNCEVGLNHSLYTMIWIKAYDTQVVKCVNLDDRVSIVS